MKQKSFKAHLKIFALPLLAVLAFSENVFAEESKKNQMPKKSLDIADEQAEQRVGRVILTAQKHLTSEENNLLNGLLQTAFDRKYLHLKSSSRGKSNDS